jgi:voltage-gated potassium channel
MFIVQIRKIANAVKDHDYAHILIRATVVTLAYAIIGAMFFHHVEGWSGVEAVYFCMVTMSTVGYGDFAPATGGGKVFTLVWIFVGIVVVFAAVANAVGLMTTPMMRSGRAMLEKAFPQQMIDIDGDGEPDFKVPRHPIIYFSKGLLPSFVFQLTMQLVSAAIFRELEGWQFGDAVWHCLVTATTVGYGDQSIATSEGKIWACCHIILSVAMLGELIGSYGELSADRTAALQRIDQLTRELDENLVNLLLQHAKELRPEVTRDGKGVTELEFVLGMLIELKIVEWGNLTPFIKQFRSFDISGNGRVGLEDVKKSLAESAEEKLTRRAAPVKMLSVAARQGLVFSKVTPFDKETAELSENASSGTDEDEALPDDVAALKAMVRMKNTRIQELGDLLQKNAGAGDHNDLLLVTREF